jgi:hypothetical protein
MEWLSFNNARIAARELVRDYAPQVVALVADTVALREEIPVQPQLISPAEGPPSAMHRWYGRIHNRLITIESETTAAVGRSSVMLYTGFLEMQDELGDWAVLLDLRTLPRSILFSRPLYIESRNVDASAIVYRPEPQGWKTAVYKAASLTEAETLLAFLKHDDWNDACFVGEPEPPGKWVTIQGGEVVLGTGSGLNSALKFACDWSVTYAPIILQVKDISGVNNDVYLVSQGRVLPL